MNKTMKVILLGTAMAAAMISAAEILLPPKAVLLPVRPRANLCRRSNREES